MIFLRDFIEKAGDDKIIVIDEAYCEYVEKTMLSRRPGPDGKISNVIVFRTFSKMYALAGLRIGYLAGSEDAVSAVRRTCVW